MIQDTIQKLEDRLKKNPAGDPASNEEALELLRALKLELNNLAKTDEQKAQNLAGLTAESAQGEKSAVDRLSASVLEFEESHPNLVDAVNRVCATLSNLGI
jgi:hypothetical protein